MIEYEIIPFNQLLLLLQRRQFFAADNSKKRQHATERPHRSQGLLKDSNGL
jgi:hypothetical protein